MTGKTIEVEGFKTDINKIELAWCAGFFDGEGCTYSRLRKHKEGWRPNPQITLNVSQSNQIPLRRFRKTIKFGKIYTTNTNRAPVHYLLLDGLEKVQQCMILLWPYLSEPKKKQYKEAISKYLIICKEVSKIPKTTGFRKMWDNRKEA